jgi:hypothetical protein
MVIFPFAVCIVAASPRACQQKVTALLLLNGHSQIKRNTLPNNCLPREKEGKFFRSDVHLNGRQSSLSATLAGSRMSSHGINPALSDHIS